MQKISKSLNNYIGITDAPNQMFGKVMSISDELIWRYFDLLSFRASAEIEQLKVAVTDEKNSRDVKIELAKELLARFHTAEDADAALNQTLFYKCHPQ